MTGLSIGCVTSVKWIGLFVTALVGAHTADELWEKFGDLRMPLVSHSLNQSISFRPQPFSHLSILIVKQRTYLKHWAARIICLIILPVIVYMSFFKIHFMSKFFFSSTIFFSQSDDTQMIDDLDA